MRVTTDHTLPNASDQWLAPQNWRRDTDGPTLSLGEPGDFDDMHIHAPCVIHEGGRYIMYYTGSRNDVAQRVFGMGMAVSHNGRDFQKLDGKPVFTFGDGKHSVLTPTVLRRPDGNVLREHGKLKIWFSATDFSNKQSPHTLHATESDDGIHWSPPTPSQLTHVYAPTIIREADRYHMWYTHVESEPWSIRHAQSTDGQDWDLTPEPVLVVDQPWEHGRLFYPTVVKADDRYILWYGSYWTDRLHTTALGVAVSEDGLRWRKSPHNPVFRPDPGRAWESHYTTSQSIMRLSDGGWRIWYATRPGPPFIHKYFAIGTAVWDDSSDARINDSRRIGHHETSSIPNRRIAQQLG